MKDDVDVDVKEGEEEGERKEEEEEGEEEDEECPVAMDVAGEAFAASNSPSVPTCLSTSSASYMCTVAHLNSLLRT